MGVHALKYVLVYACLVPGYEVGMVELQVLMQPLLLCHVCALNCVARTLREYCFNAIREAVNQLCTVQRL
jgi:hypothetical protein